MIIKTKDTEYKTKEISFKGAVILFDTYLKNRFSETTMKLYISEIISITQ